MGKLIEGFWDCNTCGSTNIRGGIRECPNCGKARDKNTTFYMNKKKITYVPNEKAVHINRNPDWKCNFCEQLNSDDDKVCVYCAAPRTAENFNYFEIKNQKKAVESEELFDSMDDEKEEIYNNYFYHSNRNFNKKSISNSFYSIKSYIFSHLSYIFIPLFTILGIGALILLFLPKEQEITITQLSWKRSINIERLQTVQESDWTLPSNASLIRTNLEFSHFQNVLDHYETKTRQVACERIVGYEEYVTGYKDLGNGYFEEITSSRPIYETYYETETYEEPIYRQEPVYLTKYYYEVDKWLYERSIQTSENDKNPYWGEFTLASDERVSSKNESFFITGLNKKDEQKVIELSYEDWNSLKVGQTVKLKVSFGHGEIVEIVQNKVQHLHLVFCISPPKGPLPQYNPDLFGYYINFHSNYLIKFVLIL